MTQTSARSCVALAFCLLTLAALTSCSNSKGGTPTSPGGGGTTTSFNFTFPAVGSSSSQVFASAGSYDYHCNAHQSSGMTGTVVVSSGSTNDSALVQVGNGSALVFEPASVTIKPGGLVRWVRPSGVTLSNHTATR